MKNTDSLSFDFIRMLLSGLVFSALGSILTLMIALLMSVLISKGTLPVSVLSFSYLTAIPGAFVSAFLTAKSAGKKLLICALSGSILYFILLLIISLIFLPALSFSSRIAAMLICCVCTGIVGALVAPGK